MQGNPLLRVLALIVSLTVTGVLIAVVIGRPTPSVISTDAPTPDEEVSAQLSLQLSSPARALQLTTLDGTRTLVDLQSPDREAEVPLEIPVHDNAFSGLLSVTWEDPEQPNFLRFILEPETLTSQELIIHAPGNLEDHAIEFTWPAD